MFFVVLVACFDWHWAWTVTGQEKNDQKLVPFLLVAPCNNGPETCTSKATYSSTRSCSYPCAEMVNIKWLVIIWLCFIWRSFFIVMALLNKCLWFFYQSCRQRASCNSPWWVFGPLPRRQWRSNWDVKGHKHFLVQSSVDKRCWSLLCHGH